MSSAGAKTLPRRRPRFRRMSPPLGAQILPWPASCAPPPTLSLSPSGSRTRRENRTGARSGTSKRGGDVDDDSRSDARTTSACLRSRCGSEDSRDTADRCVMTWDSCGFGFGVATNTGQCAAAMTRSAVEPMKTDLRCGTLWLPTTMVSALTSVASCAISRAGSPRRTWTPNTWSDVCPRADHFSVT